MEAVMLDSEMVSLVIHGPFSGSFQSDSRSAVKLTLEASAQPRYDGHPCIVLSDIFLSFLKSPSLADWNAMHSWLGSGGYFGVDFFGRLREHTLVPILATGLDDVRGAYRPSRVKTQAS